MYIHIYISSVGALSRARVWKIAIASVPSAAAAAHRGRDNTHHRAREMLCVETQSRIEFGFNKWHWTHINYDFYDDEFYETTRWNYRVCNGFQPQHGWTSLNWHLTCWAASSLTLTSNRNLFDFPSLPRKPIILLTNCPLIHWDTPPQNRVNVFPFFTFCNLLFFSHLILNIFHAIAGAPPTQPHTNKFK